MKERIEAALKQQQAVTDVLIFIKELASDKNICTVNDMLYNSVQVQMYLQNVLDIINKRVRK